MHFFESVSVGCLNFSGRITAAATTGPASGPRPASSIPAMRKNPCARSARSWRKLHFIRAQTAAFLLSEAPKQP